MGKKNGIQWKKLLWQYILFTIGSVIYAAAVALFFSAMMGAPPSMGSPSTLNIRPST